MSTAQEAPAEFSQTPPTAPDVAQIRRRTTRRKEIPVEIEDENGLVSLYTIRELTGTQRDNWLAKAQQRGLTAEGRIKNTFGVVAEFLSLTLYDPSNQLVPAKVVQEWPSSLQLELFADSQELSGLNPKAQEQAKNA